jgi:UPF0716 protein FxsA
MPFVLLYLVVEIVALVALGSVIGLAWTLAVLLAGSVLGFWLARREGLRAAQALGRAVSERRVAHQELTDGMLVAAGGVLLFVPGLVTDVAGLLLLFPPTRSLVRARLVRAAEERAPELRTARLRSAGPVVEGGVVDGTVYGTVDGTVVSDIGSDDISARPARPARSPEDGPLVIEGSVLPEERRSA